MLKISAKKLTCAAMFTAMSIVIGIFCKNFMNFGAGLFRVTFENLPIILSGVCLGPVVGGVVGCASDLISYLLSSQIYPPNFIVTFGAVTIGVVSGVVSRYMVKKQGYLQLVTAGILSHIVGSVIIKSAGLYVFYGIAVMWRIPLYFVIASIEIVVMCLLYKNSNFRNLVHSLNTTGGNRDLHSGS